MTAFPVRQSLAVSAIQMTTGEDVDANLHTAANQIKAAAQHGAQLIALPEYFALMSPDEHAKVRIAEIPGHGPIQTFLATLAQEHKVWIVGGTLPLRTDAAEKVSNTLLVFTPDGQQVARYDKVHLFQFERGTENYDESRTIVAGNQAVTFDCAGWRIGVGVCYDLRFPELFRKMGPVDLLVLPAAFTRTTGQAHWEVLLRARAIENLCYVLAPAQCGTHPGGRQTFGHSLLIDPWGEIMACQKTTPGFLSGLLVPEHLQAIRTQLPALMHRKF